MATNDEYWMINPKARDMYAEMVADFQLKYPIMTFEDIAALIKQIVIAINRESFVIHPTDEQQVGIVLDNVPNIIDNDDISELSQRVMDMMVEMSTETVN